MSFCPRMNQAAVFDAAQRLDAQATRSLLPRGKEPRPAGGRSVLSTPARRMDVPNSGADRFQGRNRRARNAACGHRRVPRCVLHGLAVAFALCVGVGLSRCGGAAKEQRPQAPQDIEPTRAVLPTEAAPEEADAPANLVAYGQISAPGTFADKVLAVAVPGLEWQKVAESQIPGFTDAFLTSATVGLGVLLSGDALDPDLRGAYALPVANADALLELLPRVNEDARPLTTRRTQVGSSCVLVEALGTAPHRLVCGISGLPDPALIDYLRAGIHKTPAPDGDIDLVVDLSRLQHRYEPLLAWIEGDSESPIAPLLRAFPKVSAALPTTVSSWRNNLKALEQGRLRLTLKDNLLHGQASLTLREGDSWLYRHSIQALASQGAAPEAFWNLPSHATSAIALLPGAPVEPGPALGPLFIAYLEDTQAPAPLLNFSKTLIASFTKNAGTVHATGHGLQRQERDANPEVGAAEPRDADATKHGSGPSALVLDYVDTWRSEWTLSVSETPLADVRTQVDQVLDILKDRASRRYLEDILSQDALAKVWPKGRFVRLKRKERISKDDFLLALTFPKTTPTAAKGGRHATQSKASTSYFLAAMRSGDTTYFGTGPDRKALIDRMKRVSTGTFEPALGSVTEAQRLREQSGRSFGYFRLGSLLLKGLHEAGIDLDPRLGALFETAGIRFWSSAREARADARDVSLNFETNFDTLVSVILTSLEARAQTDRD